MQGMSFLSKDQNQLPDVCQYLKVEHEGSVIAVCNVYKMGIPFGKNRRNRTNMVRHLGNKHLVQFSKYTVATRVNTLFENKLRIFKYKSFAWVFSMLIL